MPRAPHRVGQTSRQFKDPTQWFADKIGMDVRLGTSLSYATWSSACSLSNVAALRERSDAQPFPEFAQATTAARPAFIEQSPLAGLRFSGAPQYLTTGEGTASLGIGAGPFTIGMDSQINVLPVVGGQCPFILHKGAGNWIDVAFLDVGGYQPRHLTTNMVLGGATPCCGIADALDTARHRDVITFDGVDPSAPGSHTWKLDSVDKTVVASGPAGSVASEKNALGALPRSVPDGGVINPFRGDLRTLVIYDAVLSAGNRIALDALLAAQSIDEDAYKALGNVVFLHLPARDPVVARYDGDLSDVDTQRREGGGWNTDNGVTTTPYFLAEGGGGGPALQYSSGRYSIIEQERGNYLESRITGATQLVCAAWICPTSMAAGERLFSRMNAVVGQHCFTFTNLATGSLRFAAAINANDASNYESTAVGAVVKDKWQYVAAYYNAGVINFWVVHEDTLRTATRYSVALGNATRTGTPAVALRASTATVKFGFATFGFVGLADEWTVAVGAELSTSIVLAMANRNPRHT